jgi:hypothetical protein
MIAAANLQTDNEIVAFCASFSSNRPTNHSHQEPIHIHEEHPQLISIDNIIPEPSMSDSSLKYSGIEPTLSRPRPSGPASIKKEKKRCRILYCNTFLRY